MNDNVIRRVAYSVANSKLGEGPAVRCEGPTEYEINQALQWTRRVFEASRHAELVEELRIVAHALDRALHETGRDHDDASWWKLGAASWKRSQAFLAKLGGAA